MATEPSSPTPSNGTGSRGRTAMATPKLRDCCIGCASSKVRCPREKPACSRCVKRKMNCEYLASKRAGRKHDSSDASSIHSSSIGSSIDLNLDDPSKLNAALLATTALAATDPNAFSKLLPTLSSLFAPKGAAETTTTTAAPTTATTPAAVASAPAVPVAGATTAPTTPQATVVTTLTPLTVTAAPSPFDAQFPLSQAGLPTDIPLDPTLSYNATQPASSFGVLSPESHEPDISWTAFMPPLPTERPDTDISLNDAPDTDGDYSDILDVDMTLVGEAFDFGSSSSSSSSSTTSDNLSTGSAISPRALLNDGLTRFGDSIDMKSPSRTPAGKPVDFVGAGGDQVMVDSHCNSCLSRALELMKQLFPHPSTFCTTSEISGNVGEDALLPTVPVVIERNRHTVEAVGAMLACTCSQDAHLLAIMAHIVFKVLGWYAVAARRTPPTPSATPTATPGSRDDDGSASISSDSNHVNGGGGGVGSGQDSPARRSSTGRSSSYLEQVSWQAERVGCYRLDGDDSGRMAAQLVLSELHRVQMLVRELAAKLKAQGGTDQPTPPNAPTGDEDQQLVSPFSGAILDLLGVDLKKRLKELSVEIMKSLRNV